jgi:predicted cation transporter
MREISKFLLEGVRGVISSLIMLGGITIVLGILKLRGALDIDWIIVTLPIWLSLFTTFSLYLLYLLVKSLKK